jgi:phosphomannomutase
VDENSWTCLEGVGVKEIRIRALMQESGVAFGTSGARGLVSQMTDEVCGAYAKAFVAVLKRSFEFDRVALGIDLRPSSPRIGAACAAAMREMGVHVDYCGALPTPALALYGLTEGIPVVMVTGSHIPFDRNGIKFYRPDGEISKDDELAIGDAVVAGAGVEAVAPLAAPNQEALEAYVRRYLAFFPVGVLAGLRLGLYEHSSVAREVFRQVLEGLGAEVISLGRTEAFVPIDTEAVAEVDIERGRQWAQAYGFDAILSTDGDGDRPLISDEAGNWLRGDIVGLLCARYLGARKLAVPVSCNTAIELCGAFESVVRTRIGSPYVIAGMEACSGDGVVGFEANGGFLVASRFEREGRVLEALPTRDAVLPALAVLAAAREKGGPVSDLLKELPQRFTASDRIQEFPVETSRRLIMEMSGDTASLHRIMAPTGATEVARDSTDGLRVRFDNGEIVHLRPSGNAPELRCYGEASSQARAVSLVAEVLGRIKLAYL